MDSRRHRQRGEAGVQRGSLTVHERSVVLLLAMVITYFLKDERMMKKIGNVWVNVTNMIFRTSFLFSLCTRIWAHLFQSFD